MATTAVKHSLVSNGNQGCLASVYGDVTFKIWIDASTTVLKLKEYIVKACGIPSENTTSIWYQGKYLNEENKPVLDPREQSLYALHTWKPDAVNSLVNHGKQGYPIELRYCSKKATVLVDMSTTVEKVIERARQLLNIPSYPPLSIKCNNMCFYDDDKQSLLQASGLGNSKFEISTIL